MANRSGGRSLFDGKQWRILCAYNNNTCDEMARLKGLCYKHLNLGKKAMLEVSNTYKVYINPVY